MFCYPARGEYFRFQWILKADGKKVSETEAESQLPSQSVGKDFGKAKGLDL